MLVLDCCAAVEIARRTPVGLAMREDVLSDSHIVSSSLLYAELAHVYQKYVQANLLSAAAAQEYLAASIGLVDEFVDPAETVAEVLAEAGRLGHSSHDLFYFVLARRKACKLLTVDRRLAALCAAQGIECVTYAELG